MQDEGIEGMEDEGPYRVMLHICVAAHWVTLLAAVAVAGTIPVTPLALLGAQPALLMSPGCLACAGHACMWVHARKHPLTAAAIARPRPLAAALVTAAGVTDSM